MFYVRIISLSLIILGIIFVVLVALLSRKNSNFPILKHDDHNFCFLIPARYESKVIEDLLLSLKKQTFKVNMEDVYVIVESEKDETVNICKKYGATVVLRKHLDLKRKGYALDEAVKYILKNKKHYDAYFIFDADNILDKDYLKNMLPVFDMGYDMASGYRNCKNGEKSVIAACSALTFSLVNTVFNDKKNKMTKNITFSGTGFYIRGYLIEKWQGYPFHSLTEDYELSLYATLNNLTTFYNINSVFYDEQPVKFKDTINQRVRWIRGYFDNRKEYTKKIFKSIDKRDQNNGSKIDETIGILPYIFMVIGLLFWFLGLVFFIIYNIILNKFIWKKYLFELIIFMIIIYLIMFLMTFIILILENKKINISLNLKIKSLFYNPIFMISYVFCAIKALNSKEVKWIKIEHGNNK